MGRLTRLFFVLGLLLTPVLVYAAIDSVNKRRTSASDYEVPDGGINTAGERRASAGDYSFGLGDSGSGGLCRKMFGNDLGYILKWICP